MMTQEGWTHQERTPDKDTELQKFSPVDSSFDSQHDFNENETGKCTFTKVHLEGTYASSDPTEHTLVENIKDQTEYTLVQNTKELPSDTAKKRRLSYWCWTQW